MSLSSVSVIGNACGSGHENMNLGDNPNLKVAGLLVREPVSLRSQDGQEMARLAAGHEAALNH